MRVGDDDELGASVGHSLDKWLEETVRTDGGWAWLHDLPGGQTLAFFVPGLAPDAADDDTVAVDDDALVPSGVKGAVANLIE